MTTMDARRPAVRDSVRNPGKKRQGRATGIGRVFTTTTLLWILAVLYGLPVLWFVLSSFKPAGDLFSYPLTLLPKHWNFSGYASAWNSFDFARYFLNTFLVCAAATVLTIVASCCTGYALAKYSNKWLNVFLVCILATTMLPTEVLLAPEFLVIRDLGLYNSLTGVVAPSILTATGCFMFRQFFKTVPDDLLEAARIDGARELYTFIRIMVPISRPIMLTLAIFSFQWRWNDYIWPLLVLNNPSKFTVQLGVETIVGAQNINWSVLLGASVISIIPLIAIYLVFQKYVMNANLTAGLKD